MPFKLQGTSVRPRLERLEDRTLLSAGDLDPSFGRGGIVTTDFQGPLNIGGEGAVLQPDGKIVMVGHTPDSANGGVGLARYYPDGSLDPSFGSGGLVYARSTTTLLSDTSAVAVQSDGRIVVGGMTGQRGGSSDFALARFNPNGSLDLTFGAAGTVTTHFGASAHVQAVALQTDG
jgi:uncharacterized delta-60 repeat protein